MDGLIALALAKKGIKGVTKSIAEEYDPTKEYAEGALALKDGKLQKYVDGEWVETVITDNLGGGDIQQSEEEHVGEVVGGIAAPIDTTLSITGAAADAKATGDAIAAINGLPEVEVSGKALVSVDGEWVEQDGYGYATQAELLTGTIIWGYGSFDPVLDLVLGAKYTVSYDGNTYSDLLCHEYDGKNIIGDENIYESSAYEGDLEYPFVTDGYEIYANNVEGQVEVVIYGPVFSKMNINYLPNNNVKNGEGEYSVCEGGETVASGDYAHAEGKSEASGFCSHAEGITTASGGYSHAEGGSDASGDYSHAEGDNTEANGKYSHSEGVYTIANGDSSHVEGKYNIADTQNKYAHIIGNGTGSSTKKRHNAFMVGWDGSIHVQSADDTTKMMELTINKDGSIITKDDNNGTPHIINIDSILARLDEIETQIGEIESILETI